MDSGGSGNSVTRVEPNKQAAPLYDVLLQEGLDLYNQGGPTYFPGSTVAPFSPESEQGMAMQMARGQNGSPLIQQGGDYLSRVLGGEFLNEGNPYLEGMADRITSRTNAAVGARAGSGMHATAIGDALVPLYYGNYRDERNAMQSAVPQAQSLAQEDYRDIAAVRDVGQQRELKAQSYIDDAIQRWQFEQNKPFDKLEFLKGLIWGDPYKTQTGSSGGGSGLSSILGGAASGLAQGLIGSW